MKDRPSVTDDERDAQLDDEIDDDVDDAIADDEQPVRRPHLITVEELRAAGALDVPPEWRKSLGKSRHPVQRDPAQRELFSDLVDEDDPSDEQHPPTPRASDAETE